MADGIHASVIYRLALLVAGGLAAASAVAAPGGPDTSFNPQGTTPGIVSTDLGSVSDRANALVLQAFDVSQCQFSGQVRVFGIALKVAPAQR